MCIFDKHLLAHINCNCTVGFVCANGDIWNSAILQSGNFKWKVYGLGFFLKTCGKKYETGVQY